MTKLIIGLEMHCEMKSNSKVFSKGSNIYKKESNTNVNVVDVGFPGILPILNKKCVDNAIKAALALNCNVSETMLFDRKNYYYPDLPKGYQITQNTKPIGVNGYFDIEVNNNIKRVFISDIHLEEDSASLDHMETTSLIDYNRSGVPLLECVTTPCIESADEAVAFLDSMIRMYRYTDISDADTKKGQIRCDVNVNLQDDEGNFITPKVEIKNINSLSNVKDAILYEEKRQNEALINGEKLEQETRRWDEATGTTIHMRSKADAIDYKYFIEPNIPPFTITSDYINNIKSTIPALALERKNTYINKYNLDEYNADILIKDREIADYFEECIKIGIDSKIASNYINGLILSYLYKEEMNIKDFYLKPEYLKQIIDNQLNGNISSKMAKDIFNKSLESKKEPNEFISKEDNQISDVKVLEEIIDNILTNNEANVKLYKDGKTNIFDFFVGNVMKETRGKASPVVTKELLHNKLDN